MVPKAHVNLVIVSFRVTNVAMEDVLWKCQKIGSLFHWDNVGDDDQGQAVNASYFDLTMVV